MHKRGLFQFIVFIYLPAHLSARRVHAAETAVEELLPPGHVPVFLCMGRAQVDPAHDHLDRGRVRGCPCGGQKPGDLEGESGRWRQCRCGAFLPLHLQIFRLFHLQLQHHFPHEREASGTDAAHRHLVLHVPARTSSTSTGTRLRCRRTLRTCCSMSACSRSSSPDPSSSMWTSKRRSGTGHCTEKMLGKVFCAFSRASSRRRSLRMSPGKWRARSSTGTSRTCRCSAHGSAS